MCAHMKGVGMITVSKHYIEIARTRITEQEGKRPSDYRMAKLLGISQQHMSRLMAENSQHEISDQTAIRLAELAGVPPAEIIAKIHLKKAQKTGNEKLMDFWKKVSELAKTGALAGALTALLLPQIVVHDQEGWAKFKEESAAYVGRGSENCILC